MPLKTIGDRILDDAQDEAARLKKNAAKIAADIIDQAKSNARSLTEEAVARAEKDGTQTKRQMLASAKLASRDAVVTAKQELISEAFGLAKKALDGLSDDDYVYLTANLIAHTAEGGEEVLLDPVDMKLGKFIIDQANNVLEAGNKDKVTLAAERRPIGRGFILRRGLVEENYAFQRLLVSAREETESRIAALIFKENP